MSDIISPSPRQLVIFVHGTFSYDDREEVVSPAATPPAGPLPMSAVPVTPPSARRVPWWQRGSSFAEDLGKDLQDFAAVVPPGKDFVVVEPWWRTVLLAVRRWFRQPIPPADLGDPESVFHWSGDNSEKGRRLAGKLLLRHLRQFPGERLHVVAHSHGGSVLWEALCQAVREPENPLPKLESWTTVGTPYFQFKPNLRAAFWAVLPLVLLFGMTFWRFVPWLDDFWTMVTPYVPLPPLGTAVAFLAFLGACILPPALGLRLGWVSYRYRTALADPTRPRKEWKHRERDEVISVVIALLVAALAAPVLLFLTPRVFRNRNFWFDYGTISVLATAWMTLLVVVIVALAVRIGKVLWVAFVNGPRSETAATKAWEAFGTKGLIYAFDVCDEAIRGLAALTYGIDGDLLPRTPQPGRDQFSKGYRHLRRPEREFDHQSFFPAWWFNNLLLPLAILKEWVINPLYNTVFAGFIDQYVKSQLRRRAYGLDIAELDLHTVTAHPRPDLRPRISSAAGTEIEGLTQKRERVFIDRIRANLLADQPAALHLDELLKREFAGEAGATGVLVHTRYFDAEAFAHDVAGFIGEVDALAAGGRVASSGTPVDRPTPGRARPPSSRRRSGS